MTPLELLEDVKNRFTPLLVTDDKTLKSLLRQALSAYQDRAGVVVHVRVQKEAGVSLPYPDNYLALVDVRDGRGALVCSDDFGSCIELEIYGPVTYPLTLSYLLNFCDMPLDKWIVPPATRACIQDYLEVLIKIPNTERQRRVSIAGKLDSSALPDETTLYQRKIDLENSMSARKAIFSGATIISGR